MTEKLSFEQASKQLDEIIAKLEDGNLTLAESVALFEKAQTLVQICEKDFADAKGKLTVIHNNLEEVLNFDEKK
ncbi:MAG: exodeoxyribonuclease VII small subunit [Clostridia bacterium]|nr:exodeoxyribonuclease VII small subunit [Clostridia bacterium]